jgi:hypothetical protein
MSQPQSTPKQAPAFVLPNLLIAGAQKAGTTDIANNLALHPQAYLPPEKELLFFSNPEWTGKIGGYLRRFPFDPAVRYWIDATPGYFWTGAAADFTDVPEAAKLGITRDPSAPSHDIVGDIHATLGPNIRIVIILRHPVKRAISAFYHHFRMGRIRSEDRIRNFGFRHGVIDIGMYAHHLRQYLDRFKRPQIKILFFEEYVKDPLGQMNTLYSWLGLDTVTQLQEASGSDSNAGIKVGVEDGAIRVKGGITQIRALKKDPRFAKMRLEDPPIIEAEDLAFLARIYEAELAALATMFPKTRTLWKTLTIDNY